MAGQPPIRRTPKRARRWPWRWFGRTRTRVIDLLVITVVGGVAVGLIVAGIESGGGSQTQSTPSPANTLPAMPDQTHSETAGGPVHTWADYQTANRVAGPLLEAGRTVAIACRVTGLKVSDGDTWWYRIASAPWKGNYFASADAFYNNGRKRGPLRRTPFFDPKVPIC